MKKSADKFSAFSRVTKSPPGASFRGPIFPMSATEISSAASMPPSRITGLRSICATATDINLRRPAILSGGLEATRIASPASNVSIVFSSDVKAVGNDKSRRCQLFFFRQSYRRITAGGGVKHGDLQHRKV